MRKGVVKEICSLGRCAWRSVHMNLWPPAWKLYLAGKKIHVSLFLVERGNWRRTVIHAHMQEGALYGIRASQVDR